MRRFIILLAVILIGAGAIGSKVQGQHISVNVNINSQPSWGPVGYDFVDFYFFPEINVYYIVSANRFVYPDRGRWVTARFLPPRYRHYDLYGMYKAVLVGGPRNPWINNTAHLRNYRRFVGHRGQVVIRDSRDVRYSRSRENHRLWYSDARSNPASGRNDVRPSGREAVRPGTSKDNKTATPRVERNSKEKNSSQGRESGANRRKSTGNFDNRITNTASKR